MTRLVHLSDPHFGSIPPGRERTLLDALASIDSDLVVVSGDLTLAGRTREFIPARRFLDAIDRPILVVPGNHDVPAYNLWRRFSAPFGLYKRHIHRKLDMAWTSPDLAMLGLNTARMFDFSWNWSHGRFSPGQVRKADRFFRAHEASPVKCLVMHHPFIVPDALPGFKVVGRAQRMLAVLAAHRVDFVLSGHLHHGFWRSHAVGVEPSAWRMLVIQASTATSSRTRGEPNAFNVIDVDRQSLTLTPWESSGGPFAPVAPSTFTRTPQGWAPVAGPAVVTTQETILPPAPAEQPA